MKFLIVSALAVVCLAEPPVDRRYLPPTGAGGPPSGLYGAPAQRQTDALFRSQPARRPNNQYIPPSQQSFSAPSTQYGVPSQGVPVPGPQYGAPSAPSSQYGAPSAPSSQYGAPSAPSSQYGAPSAPSSQYGAPSAPSSQYGAPSAPSSQYGAPSAPSSQYGAPSAPSGLYGAPAFGGSANGGSFRGQEQSRQYLPPGAGGRNGYGDDEGNGEPANYSFEYMVKDEPSGNDFGHRESRQGDRAEGLYYVLLPDGRKQTVEYEADQDGYKPRISYEDTGLGQGGYNRNAQSGYNGYENQGGPY